MNTLFFFETLIIDFKPYPDSSVEYLTDLFMELICNVFKSINDSWKHEVFKIAYEL